MKKFVLVRVAILLVLATATVAALVGGRAGASHQAKTQPGVQKTEVVALKVAKTIPMRHARCRARAGI